MRKGMSDMPRGLGNGQFMSSSTVTQMKTGPDGKPVKETYKTRAHGATGKGNKVVDRQQMYEHTGTGLQKASHERMLNDKGRKVIKERIGNNINKYDHFKGMGISDTDGFDSDWNRVAGSLGFGGAGNALEYGGNRGDPFANNGGNYADRDRNYGYGKGGSKNARGLGAGERRAEARGLGMPEPSYGVDESRRGVYNNRNERLPN